MTETTDDLTRFLAWWKNTRPLRVPHADPVAFDDRVVGTTLYREGPWQVQLFTLAPNSRISSHRHPNVDSYEVGLSGDIVFEIDGKPVSEIADTPNYDGTNPYLGLPVRVLPSTFHGARSGPQGGCFVSVQRWLNDVRPTNVGNDWEPKDKQDAQRNRADA